MNLTQDELQWAAIIGIVAASYIRHLRFRNLFEWVERIGDDFIDHLKDEHNMAFKERVNKPD